MATRVCYVLPPSFRRFLNKLEQGNVVSKRQLVSALKCTEADANVTKLQVSLHQLDKSAPVPPLRETIDSSSYLPPNM